MVVATEFLSLGLVDDEQGLPLYPTWLPDGTFVSVRQANGLIAFRLFEADGTPITEFEPVSPTGNTPQFAENVTALPTGGFVVTWREVDPADTSPGVKDQLALGRVYDADAQPVGPVALVSDLGLDFGTLDNAIAELSDGTHIRARLDHTANEVVADKIARDGVTVLDVVTLSELPLNAAIGPAGPVSGPVVVEALPDGGFVAVWVRSQGIPGDFLSPSNPGPVAARVFDADGTPRGGELQVSEFGRPVFPAQDTPDITLLPDGNILLVYENADFDGVAGRILGADGTLRGPELAIPRDGEADALRPSAEIVNGLISLSWQDDDTGQVLNRTLDIPAPALGDLDYTGTAIQGGRLLADLSGLFDPDGIEPGSVTYQWLSDGQPIGGATAPSLTLTQDEVGTEISLQVTYLDDFGALSRVTGTPGDEVLDVNDPPSGLPVITGAAQIRGVLTADPAGVSDPDGLGPAAYRWLRDGQPIPGGTGDTYTVTAEDLLRPISVEMTYTDGGGTPETLVADPVLPQPLPAGILFEPSGLTVSEAGGSVTLRLALDAAPQGDLLMVLGISDPTEATLSETTLRFPVADWDVVRTVTVTGLDDQEDDGNVPFDVTLAVTGGGVDYAALSPAPLRLTNLDDGRDVGIVLNGGSAPDSLAGLDADDTLQGNAGDDTLSGGLGDDLLLGNLGNDDLRGGAGEDTLLGGTGDDALSGQEGDDSLNGETGNDRLDGGPGDDTVDGLGGHDLIDGGTGDDLLRGHAGGDTLRGGAGDDTLLGGAEDDLLLGQADDDRLWGEAGDDRLFGQIGEDTLGGGAGRDTLWGGNGDDTVFGGAGDDLVGGGAQHDLLHGQDGNDTVNAAVGHDTLNGNAGDDILNGGLGHDVLDGGIGNDTLRGHEGNDTMTGGTGADVFVFADNRDVITDFEPGVDTLILRQWLLPGGDAGDALDLAERGAQGLVFDFNGEDVLILRGVNDPGVLAGDILLV